MEALLDRDGVCERLGIHKNTFIKYRARFIALGLKRRCIGRTVRYMSSSVDDVIRNLPEDSESLRNWEEQLAAGRAKARGKKVIRCQ